jgi:hypothetical protein
VWSYVGSKIVVWDGGAEQWRPDEIVDHVFKINEEHYPVQIGIEKTGLEEFLAQPLRIEQQKRKVFLPLHMPDAPKGKYTFIEGLQPLFKSGEIEFVQELPILRAQFLSYPTGRIDGPNALAYALRMRPGEIVLKGFGAQHVVEALPIYRQRNFYLAINATRTITTAVLLQVVEGGLCIHADFVQPDPPAQALGAIVADARLALAAVGASQATLTAFAPPAHFADYDIIGLRAAARAVPIELSSGSKPEVGVDAIRALLRGSSPSGEPLVRIQLGFQSHWTTNAFASGYAFPINRHGHVGDTPEPNIYATLAEGLACIAGVVVSIGDTTGIKPNYQHTPGGQRYISALPNNNPETEIKLPYPRA